MRKAGVLMHISSLPSHYGIGTFGSEAYRFADFLCEGGQSLWQVLPLCPVGAGNSPYSSDGSFAGNPYFIDPDFLCARGLIYPDERDEPDFGKDPDRVDYGKVRAGRQFLLKRAFSRFDKAVFPDYEAFVAENSFWLEDYALYTAICDAYGAANMYGFPKELRDREANAMRRAKRELAEEIEFCKFVQYLFYDDWFRLKKYANSRGIEIIGDLPIYVCSGGADVWANRRFFALDSDGREKEVAGVPPDGFCPDGQVWGNPLYDQNELARDKYSFFCDRLRHAARMYDAVRIDHFRGLESYFCIPAGETSAKGGVWRRGPGIELFREVRRSVGDIKIIAEDLGFLTDGVRHLLSETGFPGMKVLQFAFDSREDSDYLPHNYPRNCVVYTGTHDNPTINEWFATASRDDVEFAKKYMRLNEYEGYNFGMMKCAWASVADTAIVTMQDLLGLGAEARMNTPGVALGNWEWRVRGECINSWLASIMRENAEIYRRLP